MRANSRRIYRAFADAWPGRINVMYAIKANNNPAVRAILHQEGAGGDCFGLGELHATFLGGADPDRVAMNGSNKTLGEMHRAAERGVYFNIDAEEEIGDLAKVAARLERPIRVNLRIKIVPESWAELGSDYFGVASDLKRFLNREKWGFSAAAAPRLVTRILETPGLDFTGFSAHTGRFARNPALFAEYTAEMGKTVVRLCQATGARPKILDIGGGWPRERDPESRSYALNPHAIESFAGAATGALLEPLEEAGLPTPDLWLEPGRYLIGNAALLLGTVGAIKTDLGMTWVHVDFSTNNLMRRDTNDSAYHLLAAGGMHRAFTRKVQIVGPTCIDSRFADDWPMPDVRRGEPVALLDAGMYAETTSTQFNGIPRPATVLVRGGEAELIKERETVEDVFAKCRLPLRLRPGEDARAAPRD